MPAPVWVIGGGTAGCTVLGRLAAATGAPLVLAEPGPLSERDDEPGFCGPAVDARLVRTRQVSVCDGGPPFDLLEARALGGGSAVNGMLLTGAVPPGLEGLTHRASVDEAGPVGRLLLGRGGEPVRLWWNNGRWNPGRAAHHLVEEGRVERVSAEVDSLVIEDGRVRAVSMGGRTHAVKGVVMCAGAIETPLLLMRSGLGTAMPGLGEGLQNHPEVAADFSVPESFGDGHDACIARASVTDSGRHLLTVAYERVPGGVPKRGRLATILLDPVSRGRVWMDGALARVRFAALSDHGDWAAMVTAARSLAALCADLENSGAILDARIGARPVGEWTMLSDSEIERELPAVVGVVSHPTSSCAEVVDESGKLRGVAGIWIADASALSRVPECTPAAEVVVLARRVADVAGTTLR